MSDDPYCYPPDFKTLRNKLNIRDADALERAETAFVTARMAQKLPSGLFDLEHLQSIHRHLFQDIYPWAGEVRTVEIAKGSTQFQHRRFIQTGMADIHRRLQSKSYLTNTSIAGFAKEAGQIIGDLNHVHPFREGNGRTQLVYLAQLAMKAGHDINLSRINKERWLSASIAAHKADYTPMAEEICSALQIGRRVSRDVDVGKKHKNKDDDRYR